MDGLFGRRALDKLDALGDVALEAIIGDLEKLLLVVIGAADNVNGLLSTGRLFHSQSSSS